MAELKECCSGTLILINYLGLPDAQPDEPVPAKTEPFGKADPKEMPLYFFMGALHIDYATAVRAEITAQDYTVVPRHWYIDTAFQCADCGSEFVWPAEEQRVWFETYRFYVLSRATRCRDCSAKRRDAFELRREYDSLVSLARSHGTLEQKQRVVDIVDYLEDYVRVLPERMIETRDLFRRQSEKSS